MDSSNSTNGLSMSPSTASLFSQFKEISSKVRTKTRGIIGPKRVNLHEISEQFVRLGRELGPYSKQYQANCNLAAARTERLIQSPSAAALEFEHLLESARMFRDAAFEPPFDPEKDGDCEELENAIALYKDAIKLCREEMLPAIWQELARVYLRVKRFPDAGLCYREAGCVIKAAISFIQAGDFASALCCYEKASDVVLCDEDRITMFLLKLICHNIHLLRVSSDRNLPEASEESNTPVFRRINSINTNDSSTLIRFPILPVSESPLVTATGTFSKCPRQGVTEETTSINVLLESLYLFLRDVRDANQVPCNNISGNNSNSNNNNNNKEEEENGQSDTFECLKSNILQSDTEGEFSICDEREVRHELGRQLYTKLGHNAIHKLLLGQVLIKDLL